MSENWTPKVIDLTNDIVTVSATPVILRGYHVNVTISVEDTKISDGANMVFTIPGGTVAGTVVEFSSDEGVIFDTSLIIDPHNEISTGNITILYKERV